MATFYVTMRLTAYNTKVLNQEFSTDKKWVAFIEQIDPKAMFGPSHYAVVLQPKTGWFRAFQAIKVFEESTESAQMLPKLTWDAPDVLTITSDAIPRDVSTQLNDYYSLHIKYVFQ